MDQQEELISSQLNLHAVAGLQSIHVRDGLYLRPLEPEDGEQILRILEQDPTIRERVTFAARVFSLDDYLDQLHIIAADPGLIRYAIISDNTIVGLVSLWRDKGFFGQTAEPDGYGFGYFLSPDARGKGIITQSVASIMKVLQSSLRVKKFIAFSEDDNDESKAVLLRLGFEPKDELLKEPTHGWFERKYVFVPEPVDA